MNYVLLKLFPYFAVEGFGIIGGGAVLFTAAAFAGQTVLPQIGLGLLTDKLN